MGNYNVTVRARRWAKFAWNVIGERIRGLDFSMVYVGELQRNTREFHGYSMTDAGAMKEMLRSLPLDRGSSAFIDIGCGKGMCMKCAVESGFGKVSGLDLDSHLLEIAKRNMEKLHMDASCIYGNAVEFQDYKDYDVFYFYNPFGASVFQQVIEKIKESRQERSRDIWVVYYHPVQAKLFEAAGFTLHKELREKTRDTTTRLYVYPKENS